MPSWPNTGVLKYKSGRKRSWPYLIGQHPSSPVFGQKRPGAPIPFYFAQLPPVVGHILFPFGRLLEQTSLDHKNRYHKNFARVTLRLANNSRSHNPNHKNNLQKVQPDVYRGIDSSQRCQFSCLTIVMSSFFFFFFFFFLVGANFPEHSVPLPFLSFVRRVAYTFFFSDDVFFLPYDHGLDCGISLLCYNSINQSNQACSTFCLHHLECLGGGD